MKKFLLSVCYVLGMSLSSHAAAELNVGDVAPEFTLKDQHENNVSLSDMAGRWVVLYFYPKNDTPGCTTEACSFRDNINKLIEQKATILGVSIDTVKSHQEFIKKHDLPFQLLADPRAIVAARYGSMLNLGIVRLAKRHSFIIDPTGHIAKIYRDVDPDTHVAEVLEDLKRLQENW